MNRRISCRSWLIIVGLVCDCAVIAAAAEKPLFQSSQQQTAMIELFTSEGCSSCPPAEAWLNKLRNEPGLWKAFVPVAFHVDYWNKLGWKDRFSSASFTQRQRDYAASWGTDTIYTPAYVINGREAHSPALPAAAANAGLLQVTQAANNGLTIFYSPSTNGEWDAHVVLLGSGLSSKVGGGENAGRELRHEFVALDYKKTRMMRDGDRFRADCTFSSARTGQSARSGIAAWVTPRGQLKPVQATGGWLASP
jgi:hypothetical protein